MESGSVLSESLTLPTHCGYPSADKFGSMTVISSSNKSLNSGQQQPRMSQLENLEAKMANIEVSLSSSNFGRRRKGTSLGGGTISARSSPRPESKKEFLRSASHDREAVIQNLRIQLCLGKLPRPTGPPLDENEKPAAEQKLIRLKTDAENKRIAIRNLKSALNKLDITDNIDVRIRQAELEYALGREELQLLSIVEEARALQARLDKSKPESNSLYNILTSGINLSLHAVQATVGRWAAYQKPDFPGLYVEWALDGEGLFRGDRILEVNGKIVNYRTREELQKNLGSDGKCQLVVIRKKTLSLAHQQLLQQQEDNLRLQHRISYLEEQVRELQTSKESSNLSVHNSNNNGNNSNELSSGHVTSINISSPQQQQTSTATASSLSASRTTSQTKPQIYQRGNFITTLVGGKPTTELTESCQQKAHITKTIIKETASGSLTDNENNYIAPVPIPVTKSLSASKISISSESNYNCHKREREWREYSHNHHQNDRNSLIRTHPPHSNSSKSINDDVHHHHHLYSHHHIRSNAHRNHHHNHTRSVEHLNYNNGKELNDMTTSSSSSKLDHQQQHQAAVATRIFNVNNYDFDHDINYNNNINNSNCNSNSKKRNIDYTSEPVEQRVRPTPPKKPLRLSLQRAQSLQTVENLQHTPSTLTDIIDKKKYLKRTHNSEKKANDSSLMFLMHSSSGSQNGNISNSSSTSNNNNSNNNVPPLYTASLGRQKNI